MPINKYRQGPGGRINGAYSPDDSTDSQGFHHLPTYNPPNYNKMAFSSTPHYPQLNASTSDVTGNSPISVIGREGLQHHRGAEYPGMRGTPEGKPSSVDSDPPSNFHPLSDRKDPSAFKPVLPHSEFNSNHKQEVTADYHYPPKPATRRKGANADWLSSTSGWHDDDGAEEYDPSMDIEKAPSYSNNVLLTPSSLGHPRTPPGAPVPSPRGAYSEMAPKRYGNNRDSDHQRGAGLVEPRQLSYEDRDKWKNDGPYVSSTLSNV